MTGVPAFTEADGRDLAINLFHDLRGQNERLYEDDDASPSRLTCARAYASVLRQYLDQVADKPELTEGLLQMVGTMLAANADGCCLSVEDLEREAIDLTDNA